MSWRPIDLDVDLAVYYRRYHVGLGGWFVMSPILSLTGFCLRFREEGLSAREGLLLWCQRKTSVPPYSEDGVEVRDFGKSFTSGLAL